MTFACWFSGLYRDWCRSLAAHPWARSSQLHHN